MSIKSRLKAIQTIGQRKAFYRQRIPEPSCARKETVDIDILVRSRNAERKIMQSIKNYKQTSHKNKEVEPVEPVQINIYKSNTYRKDLSWLYIDNEPRVQERQQVKDQQSSISVFVAYPRIPSSNQDNSLDMTTVFHAWQYGRFIEIQNNLGEKNFIEQIKPSIFLEAVLAIEIM